ncbi:2OG-Fe(II) oxygenase, partial [Sphingomonas sp. AOB5]|uniref:2OG-Fe(II) oxygenase n=1 Tax=Sphingomonas sp. AOB5 TaxID=3034017 RepID=UPI0023FA1B68
GPLVGAEGPVAQTRVGGGDTIGWHNDLGNPHRRLAIIVNLSDDPFEGGEFELEHVPTGTMLARHRHTGPGSTLIFTVAKGLRHRVLPITAGGPRRVFAGWFLGPDPVRRMARLQDRNGLPISAA